MQAIRLIEIRRPGPLKHQSPCRRNGQHTGTDRIGCAAIAGFGLRQKMLSPLQAMAREKMIADMEAAL